ncbi:hypothetical protein DCN14_11890 [Burkholderia sp. IDO3]|nr:hypothetical protein DCN14_11890 [Burkholderia sp. IDO3]
MNREGRFTGSSGKARAVTCTKRTCMAEKAKNASKFINPPKIRTTRIEPSAALLWKRWKPRYGGPRASVFRPLFLSRTHYVEHPAFLLAAPCRA